MAGQPGSEDRKKVEHAAEAITLAAVAALAAEALLPGSGAPSWVLPATEIIAGWGGALVTWSSGGGWFLPGYLAAYGSLLGGWTILAEQAGLWTGTALGAWLAGLAVLSPVGLVAALRRRDKTPELPPALVPAAIEPDPLQMEMAKFEHLLDEVLPELKDSPVRVVSLEEGAAGRVLRLQLPRSGGATVTTLRDKARTIEVMLQAQEGAVGFELGDHSGDVIMRIRERNGLVEVATLTPDLRARTVNEPLIMGRQEDGSWLKMLFREMHALVVGTTGSGKSNWINVLIAQLASCNDTVIWMIDMKQGRAGRPWFQAWEDGRAAAPAIDWLATTREEAWLMMQAVLAAAEVRAASGIGGNKIIPNPALPQICLIVDETAIIFGSERGTRADVGDSAHTNTEFIRKEDEVLQTGRSEAVLGVFATQRGTNSMAGSGDSKANLTTRVALKLASIGEYQYVIPDVPGFAPKQLTYLCTTPGVGLVAQGASVSGITKFLHHDHIEGECGKDHARPHCAPGCPVYATALDTGNIRPSLDRMTATKLGESYANRWRRAAETGVIRVPLAVLNGGRVTPVDIDGFDEIVSGVPDPEKELHPDRIRYRQFLSARGVMGATPKIIWEHLEEQGVADGREPQENGSHTVTRECLQRWMREDESDGIVNNPDMGRWKFGPGDRRRNAA
jgi:FtsK/SpoIIIE family